MLKFITQYVLVGISVNDWIFYAISLSIQNEK